MREIEFRAWTGTEMVYDFAVINGKAFIQENPKTSNRIIADIDGKERTFYDDWATYRPKDWVLMQYIGLKDKNGVKIFKGDVVCGWKHDKNKKFKVEYEPSNYVCGFVCKELYPDNTGCILPGYQGIEVIGNIYENPEFMDGDK